jgi:hypothetical protein
MDCVVRKLALIVLTIAVLCCLAALIYLNPRRVDGVVIDGLTQEGVAAVLQMGARSVEADSAGQYHAGWVWGDTSLIVEVEGYLPTQVTVPRADLPGRAVLANVVVKPRMLSITVRDAETGDLLDGAVVTVGGISTRTDKDGVVVLYRMPEDNTVGIFMPGYEAASLVAPGQGSEEHLLHPVVTAVRVVDSYTQGPLMGTTVSWDRERVVTGAGGSADLRRLTTGVTVTFEALGYATATRVFEGDATLSVALRPTTLSGVVTDADGGLPVKGARVVVSSDGQVVAETQTDDAGRYLFAGLPESRNVTVSADGYDSERSRIGLVTEMKHQLRRFRVRGLYMPLGILTSEERVNAMIALTERTECNAIIVDVKNDRGWLAFPSEQPAALKSGAYKPELMSMHQFVSLCKEKGVYLIARIVLFKDPSLAEAYPEWMVHKPDGSLWADREGAPWADPFREEVQDYLIGLAKEAALLGFDELQFDYLRFPSDGEVLQIHYVQESTLDSRCAMMKSFCARLRKELEPYPVLLSADVFGLTVWVDPEFDLGIGQRIKDIAPYMDYVSPMLYPLTFTKGNLDLDEPYRQPYEVVYRACVALAERTDTPIRPWLQHYWLESQPYGVKELRQQRQAAIDADTEGWMFWNSAGQYIESVFDPAE